VVLGAVWSDALFVGIIGRTKPIDTELVELSHILAQRLRKYLVMLVPGSVTIAAIYLSADIFNPPHRR
jgi:hypothetical protein